MQNRYNIDKLLIATNNINKAREIAKLLAHLEIETISLDSYNIVEPEEIGLTFIENSMLKAEYYGKITNLPALADDSGICIDSLDGFPGVFSARLAKNQNDYKDAINSIENKLKNKNLSESKASFVCSLSLWLPENQFYSFEGTVHGSINFPGKGDHGFAYDKIFTPNGYNQTFAEMLPEAKNKISHRSIAIEKFINSCQ